MVGTDNFLKRTCQHMLHKAYANNSIGYPVK